MKLKSTWIAGVACAVMMSFAAAPVLAGHKHMGYYSPGHYGQGKGPMGYGPRHGMRACHGKRMGMYGQRYGMHPGYGQRYGMQPGHGKGAPYAMPQGYGADEAAGDTAAQQDIVATAIAAGNFDTLVSAVKAADLVETLQGTGPFTVLAPTDDAFSKLPGDQVAALMSDPEALTGVLTYHVIAGRLSAADLLQQGEFETVNGAKLTLAQLDVSATDIETSNGVIHVLDTVLLPPQ